MDHCHNCDAESSKGLLIRKLHWSECQACNSWIVDPCGFDAAQLYSESYFHGGEYTDYEKSAGAHMNNFRKKISYLVPLLKGLRGLRLLEIGCATGFFMEIFGDRLGAESIGVEVSDYCRRIATAKGHRVYAPNDDGLSNVLADYRPNIIVGWDVWEHLERPADIWKSYLKFADRDCVTSLTTVDSSSLNARLRGHRWRQFHPPSHLNYPSRVALRRFFTGVGFDVRSQFSFGSERSLAEYASALVGRRSILTSTKWMHKLSFPLNLGDTQMVIASRGLRKSL